MRAAAMRGRVSLTTIRISNLCHLLSLCYSNREMPEEIFFIAMIEWIEFQIALIYLFPPLMLASDKTVFLLAQLLQRRAT
ncbi:MAG TPA: hypothetical protein VJ385_12870 [Fibrobacteria bacterium]|nr:hypothetical protein [Fibrobacteria bacterium]